MTEPIDAVVDASVIVAYMRGEPGTDEPFLNFGNCAISAVNLAESLTRASDLGIPPARAQALVEALGLVDVPFDEAVAYATAALRRATRHLGLSLGDRACLATAKMLGVPAVTADRNWASLELGIDIKVIR